MDAAAFSADKSVSEAEEEEEVQAVVGGEGDQAQGEEPASLLDGTGSQGGGSSADDRCRSLLSSELVCGLVRVLAWEKRVWLPCDACCVARLPCHPQPVALLLLHVVRQSHEHACKKQVSARKALHGVASVVFMHTDVHTRTCAWRSCCSYEILPLWFFFLSLILISCEHWIECERALIKKTDKQTTLVVV